MKQQPSELKFKKYHKPKSSFFYLHNNDIFLPKQGSFALQAIESGMLTFKQIESARRTIRRASNKSASIYINVFTNISISKKPLASRMGKGKGNHSMWVCAVRKGQVIYEVGGLSPDTSKKALLGAKTKLPVKTQVVRLFY